MPNSFKDQIAKSYSTKLGSMWHGSIESALMQEPLDGLKGKFDLIFTSPPYPLKKKKKYGNKTGDDYLQWLTGLAPKIADLLSPTGSVVIEIGNAWESGVPEMSTLPLKTLLGFQEAANLKLCQHIVWHNPARLPSPGQWVTIERIRLKDSFTHVWWMSKSSKPKADNRRVLIPYSKDMKGLLNKQDYNRGKRPSGHVISENGFLKDHGGSISASVIDSADHKRFPESLLQFSNTKWDANYSDFCRKNDLPAHPARMPIDLAAFMIQFLTEPGDLVLDPFAGSNTTGAAAEMLDRRWISIEAQETYIDGSQARFENSIIESSKATFMTNDLTREIICE